MNSRPKRRAAPVDKFDVSEVYSAPQSLHAKKRPRAQEVSLNDAPLSDCGTTDRDGCASPLEEEIEVFSFERDAASYASGGAGGGCASTSQEDSPFTAPESNVVRLRMARCLMPYRWKEPPAKFASCLASLSAQDATAAAASVGLSRGVLRGALYGDEVAASSWLTSAFMDLVMAQFARFYPGPRFMPAEFAAFGLRKAGRCGAAAAVAANDVLGRPLDYASREPFIFLVNVLNHHWQLLRVQIEPYPELQLFEPMGKPAKRGTAGVNGSGGGGLSSRHVPSDVLRWLDSAYPLDGSGGWQRRSYSAVTRQQQTTGFDCGVAALLYAEKCGQGQLREDIDAFTSQADLTDFRALLQRFSETLSREEED